MSRRLVRSRRAADRLAVAEAWLNGLPASRPALLLAAERTAAWDLVRRVATQTGSSLGRRCATLHQLATELASPRLAERGLAVASGVAVEAVCARVVARLGPEELGRFAPVIDTPGLPRALARTLDELRRAGAEPASLPQELRRVADAFERALAEAGLADRSLLLQTAAEVAEEPGAAPPLDLPLLLLDLAPADAAEARLLSAVATRAPTLLATSPAGDEVGEARLAGALGLEAETLHVAPSDALGRLQRHLFGRAPEPGRGQDPSLVMLSAPGESRECVELARRIQRAAAEGVPFDQMAVLLRSPALYRPHLDEALRRAGIPAWFERGARRPDPAGRAMLALLACRTEGLSARRFSEYLSLGQVPPVEGDGGPPPVVEGGERWVPAEDPLEDEVEREREVDHDHEREHEVDHDHEREHEVEVEVDHDHEREHEVEVDQAHAGVPPLPRSPRRWERLLVDAVVVSGLDRWTRRLDAARASMSARLQTLEPDAPARLWLQRRVDDLDSLSAFALPLLRDLDTLPEQAMWGEWLELLGDLATRALRWPDRVLALLAALQPAASTGPVSLGEVRLVLKQRLGEVVERSKGRRYGRLFVGPISSARGRSFERVFVPGLAERLFPQKVVEDPVLLDSQRRALDVPLRTNSDRVADERTALRLAVGAASQRLVLSWPRLDESQGRPRVPSFYGLEAVRAAEGHLPGFDALAERARLEGKARLARPAPDDPALAIDEAEHDLSRLYGVRRRSRAEAAGTLRYLLSANPFLARSLRARYARWSMKRFTAFDGLIDPRPEALAGLAGHQLDQRSFSATALQDFAACPYRFLLRSVHRLSPRQEPEELEYIDPMSRGSLIHDVQFELLTRLRAQGELPITRRSLAAARDVMDATLDAVAQRYADELVPAIPRVWRDAVEAMRTDLGEWLRRMAEEPRWVPHRFELSFGLKGRDGRDEHSTDDPAVLDCGIRLRGAIDLVERDDGGHLRMTDYKTGRARVSGDAVIKGGQALQPVLYALAAERLFEGARVDSGRLWYCTTVGGFADVVVPLDDEARAAADVLAASLTGRLEQGALPARPREGACDWCDYRPVCGPAEELRTRGKGLTAIDDLERLRGHR